MLETGAALFPEGTMRRFSFCLVPQAEQLLAMIAELERVAREVCWDHGTCDRQQGLRLRKSLV
ncbi:hypothetical protein DYI23_11965 [Roseibium polysiphoniae]|uniref:Uncharacterized protein n=1 Tax=Roseibium polysiphoniae TaxID=2571221 RepID=A0A944CD93_9HYPH|nr:hypothetical protein [Roseibium polysiphoniae]